MVTLTEEQRREITRAQGYPVRVEDPETNNAYVILRVEIYHRLREHLLEEEIDPSIFEIDDYELPNGDSE
jgi:hypothetical protein